jgi:hypothetical protein
MTINLPNRFRLPVSISDLPGSDFSVTPETSTETVVRELENHPSLPGVLVIENSQLLGVITRLKLFEWLGHCLGLDQFLQKPIFQLFGLIRTRSQPVPGYFRIDEAIQYALSRPGQDVYDPIAVLHEDGSLKLLEISSLLQVQSQTMASLSNVLENLGKIDQLILSGFGQAEIFDQVLQLLRQSVPYHQAAILVSHATRLDFLACSGYSPIPTQGDEILTSPAYTLINKHRQAIYIANPKQTLAWKGMEVLGTPMAWLGVPLLLENRSIGLLSLSRNVERAFSHDERETAKAFAQRLSEALQREKPAANRLVELTQPFNLSLKPIEVLSLPGQAEAGGLTLHL